MYLRDKFNTLFPKGTEAEFKIFIAGATVALSYVRQATVCEAERKERATNLVLEISALIDLSRIN